MALTLEGSALTEAHRVAQATLQAEAVQDLASVWPLLDPSDLDGSFERYARAAMVVLDLRREQSAAVASAYYEAFRDVEGVTKPLTDLPALARLAEEQALTSLFVTGPVEAKRTMARQSRTILDRATSLDPEAPPPLSTRTAQAMERAFVTSAGSVMRLTADAGREVIRGAVLRDDAAVGWARVTDGSPCAFCAMLASRGIDYKRGSFAASDPRFTGKGTAKVHDHCGCTSEPVFRDSDYNLPGRAQEFADLWERTGKHYSGDDAINAFRRAYERPQLHLP